LVRASSVGAAPGVVPNTPNQTPFLSSSLDRSAHSPPPYLISCAARSGVDARQTIATNVPGRCPHGFAPATSSRLGSWPGASCCTRNSRVKPSGSATPNPSGWGAPLIWLSYIRRASSVWMAPRALSSDGTVVSAHACGTYDAQANRGVNSSEANRMRMGKGSVLGVEEAGAG